LRQAIKDQTNYTVGDRPGSAPTPPRACIIGAGSSGMVAAKALAERGIPFDCFEKSDQVGGNWVFGNRNGMSSAYRDLYIDSSRARMEYSDFPMPASYPDFPHHTQIRAYFDAYVDHFGLREQITFQTGVEHADRREDGVWEVTLEGGETREYGALLVANGHHWDPRWPEPPFPGADTFAGEQLHAHFYRDNSIFAGKNVVVLGLGNSAVDIAVESSYAAAHTYLAARRGAWIVPKYLFGRPLDQLNNDPRVPIKLRQRLAHALVRAYTGPPERYGLPKPDHRFGEAHPTVSGRVLDRIQHGTIVPKPNIAALEGGQVRFLDGSVVDADVVVYCTGYKITFPFFDPGLLSAPDNHIELFRRVFHPDIPNLFFIGLFCSRSARSCRSPRRKAPGWATTCSGATRCLTRRRCASTFRPTKPPCASASSPPSAIRSRSTSTTTSTPSRRSVARALSGHAHRALHPL
jgi:dimethylaniline monooxygenase (N-oxide forming)